jgi:hypothetical protein
MAAAARASSARARTPVQSIYPTRRGQGQDRPGGTICRASLGVSSGNGGIACPLMAPATGDLVRTDVHTAWERELEGGDARDYESFVQSAAVCV